VAYALGIDIGTTYSAAAVARNGRSDILSLGTDVASVPTVVVLRADGEVLVGEAAERRAMTEPDRVAREFKRRIGDPVPIIVGGTPYGVEALTGHVLQWIVARANEQQGGPPDAVCLTHPANWGTFKQDLLHQAARLAGLGDVHLLTEPQAAALRYAAEGRVDPGSVVAVYDFGGGTFDAALVRSEPAGFELLGTPEGMERLGGIDFDQAVFAHVDRSLDGMVRELDHDDPAVRAAVTRLRADCRRAKEALSSDTDSVIPVLLPTLQTEVRITRAEFEAMIRPRVVETIDALRRAVSSADLAMGDLYRVLLVGGSSRIPLVGELVREATGVPVTLDSHPKFSIALGAALHMSPAVPAVAATPTPPPPTAPVITPPAPDTAAPAPAPSPSPPEAVPAERSRLPWFVGGAIVLAVLGMLGIVLLRGGADDGETAVTTPMSTPTPSLNSAPAAATTPTTATSGESIPPATAATTPSPTTTPATEPTATSPPTTPPTTAVPPQAAGYTSRADDSGILTVELPVEWNDLDASSLVLYTTPTPHISASSVLDAYLESWTFEGISVMAVDLFEAGTTSVLLDDLSTALGYPFDCTLAVAGGYDDGRLVGEVWSWQDCAFSGNEIRLVAAGPPGASYVFLVGMQSTLGADFSALDHALDTIRLLGE
jgi:actin-like ATPase involved in cell morphogenesis